MLQLGSSSYSAAAITNPMGNGLGRPPKTNKSLVCLIPAKSSQEGRKFDVTTKNSKKPKEPWKKFYNKEDTFYFCAETMNLNPIRYTLRNRKYLFNK